MIGLPRDIYDTLVRHACEGVPREVCGVLGGDYGEDISCVTSAHRAANAAETPKTEYYIDPREQLEYIETIEDSGEEVVGFYHSHPTGPRQPSQTDTERATWPGVSYVIVILDGDYPYVGSWRWVDEAETFDQEIVRLR